jgi:Tn3 transposase DDE domain
MTKALQQLLEEGHTLDIEALSTLSPYRTEHINRFGNYVINPDRLPEPLEQHLGFSLSPGRNSPLPFFTSWVLQLASLQQSRCLSASLQPPLPVFAPPASA